MKKLNELQSYLTRLRGLMLTLIILCSIGSGNAWGAEEQINANSGVYSGSGNSGIHTWNMTSCTVVQAKGTGTSVNSSYPNRWYQNNLITFTPKSGYTISKIELNGSSGSYNGQTMAVTSGGGSLAVSSNKTTWTGTATSAVTIRLGTQFRFGSVKITYSASASYSVVWTINPAAGGSLSATSGTSTTVTPNSAYTYGDPAYTVTTGTASVSQSTNTFTATPSANCTIRINMVEKPRYTITYNAGTGTCGTSTWQQPSYGASTSLPSATAPATCTGYSFAGWCITSAGSSDNNTSSPGTILAAGDSYTPTDDVTLYAVYTKTEGGGGGVTWSLCSTVGDVTAGTYVITWDNTYYLPSETTGTSPAVGSGITQSNNQLTNTVTSAMQWTFTGNNTDGFAVSHVSGNNTYKLHATNSSTGINVTTGSTSIVWKASVDNTYGMLLHGSDGGTRNLAVYNSASWRYYATGNSYTGTLRLYKQTGGGGTTYYMTSLVCCTPLASINGSFSFTSVGTTGATANWGWTGATTGISKNILKVYKESDNSLVATIDNISASATSQAITGLDPCTEYYVKLSTVSSGGGYCDGVADQTGASHVTFTTSSYTVTKTGVTNVTAASLSAIPATTCASGFGPITIEAASGYVLPATVTVTGATGSWTQASGSLTISSVTGNVSITITPTAASCASFSFHTGTGDDATVKTTNTTTCFSQVNSSTTWKIDNYVIPADTKFFVGDRGFFYDDNLGSNNSRSAVKTWSQEMFFEYTKAYGDGYRPTVGQATGAIGTLYIWSDNNWNNLHVGFSPQGYVFKLGSTNLAMSGSATLDADRYWETSVITLTSTDISGTYQTNLYTGSAGGVASNNTQSTAVNTMGVKTNAGDNWRGTAINDGTDANTRGFFRIDIGDGGTKNWHAHWVPTHRVIFHSNYPGGGGPADTYSVDVSVEETNNSIALASAPSNPTGYTFAGWYDAADGGNHITTARTISAGASANVELWAHWTANTIALTLDKNNNDASGSTSGSASVKYDNTALETGTTHATREHYTLEGYYAEAGCTHKVLTAAGALVNYTGYVESDKWVRNTTPTTLYANWTPANYTVTWYAGGTASGNITTAGNPSTSVAYNSKVTDLPTNPDGSACDKVFVGWTDDTDYDHGTSLLFTDAAGSPTITGATNFYAVFAEDGGSSYVLVESDLGTDWAGDYLIAYSSTVFADGRVGGTGTGGMGKQYQKANPDDKLEGKVVDVDWGDTYHVTLEEISSNSNTYLLKTQDGLYNYVSGNSNGLSTTSTRATAEQYPITVTFTSSSDVKLGLGGVADGAVFRYNASEYFRYYANCTQNAVYLYKKTGGYTGHTITCADCGTSVTPTYTAAPTGGTVAVTKGGNAVTSGSTVKTCTSQEFSVTLTPATHYTLTGFTASGLTTGTATISPTVGSVLPTASAQTFTVTVSASATGTLNLTPTFTPETPLTITLNTNGKGTYSDPAEWPIYAGESFTLPNVTPNDPSCATFVGWIQGTTFPGDGSTHDAPVTISAGSSSGALSVNTTYTAVFYETETSETDAYVKLTSAPANWANDHYLIVYESGGLAFDGSRTDAVDDKIDASYNTVDVTITSGAIAATSALAASEWKIALISGSNYSIQSASGKYIGNASNSNALTTSAEALANTLSISSGDFGVESSGGAYLRYNATSGQERFRYYKSSSYSSQQAIQLFKLGTAVVETQTYTTNPACTPKYRVTVASVTGGSPNADPKFNPEGDEVTLTAHPAAGYSFTGWTITHTEGGAAASVTYTTGSASTETAVFEMPAYDVTVTATYAKIPVASLQVKDGETVIANSGTVNISTGANKTLTVVVTPADAFDHSWSASVTGGGTYASITNVQAGTFQVNGLAQGDATVTVTAPNDGDAKTVTFTVHVTDILPTEVVLKRDGSSTPISELSIYEGQYVKVNVSFTPTPTNKDFSVSADGTFVTIHAHAHTNPNYYATLNGKKVTTSPVNVTFTSAATASVTKNLVVTVLALPADQFIDYIHGNATVTRAAQVSADHWSINTSITTPTLSDAAESASADCEEGHYHLIGWLPQATAESLWAAGTPITSATEGLVAAGAEIEASGITWYAIWAKKE